MKEYPVEQWHEKAMNDANIILINYFPSFKDFGGWLFSHKLFEAPEPNIQNTAYFFKRNPDDNEEAIRIDVTEADSITYAEQALLSMLTNVMAPMEFPQLKGDENPGVVCYKGFSDVDSLLMFLRANIVIRVRSIGRKEIPVLNEAKKIDADIVSVTEPKDAGVLQLKIDMSAPAEDVLKQLALNTEDALGKKVYYKIIAPDHTIELTRSGIDGEHVLTNNIILYTVGEDGSVVRVELK